MVVRLDARSVTAVVPDPLDTEGQRQPPILIENTLLGIAGHIRSFELRGRFPELKSGSILPDLPMCRRPCEGQFGVHSEWQAIELDRKPEAPGESGAV